MGLEKQILLKNELQTSETCAILDMSRQNLYKMRKEGRMHRLIESQDSKFYKDSVYQEWFQRHMKALNMQLPLTPMTDMIALANHFEHDTNERMFSSKAFAPVINVLLSNYGTTQTPIKIPYEYTMRLYHVISGYMMELIFNFENATIHNSRIESEINAFIQSLYQQVSNESTFKTYIDALKRHCYRSCDILSLIRAFIEATDIYDGRTICQDYLDVYADYYDVFRENLVITMLHLIEYVITDIYFYQKDGEKERLQVTMINAYGSSRENMHTWINQVLSLLYDTRGILTS